MPAPICCTSCKTPVPVEQFNSPVFLPCPGCRSMHWVAVFPAQFQQRPPVARAESVLVEGESNCYNHPQKRAVVACESCGRFLCALCDIDLGNGHLCASCIESGRKKGKLRNLQNHRTLYDTLALRMATLPILIPYFTIITGPVTIYLCIRYWNAESSIVRRGKARLWVALILASLQIIGWGALLYALIFHLRG